jgi:hypothetical protein
MILNEILQRKHISARRNLFLLNDMKGALFYVMVENPVSENSIWNYSSDSINGCLVYLKKSDDERSKNVEMFLPVENIRSNDENSINYDFLFKLKKVSPFTINESPELYGNACEYDLKNDIKKSEWKKVSFKVTESKYLLRKGKLFF